MGKLYKRGGTWYADYLDRSGTRRRVTTRTSDVVVARARLRDLELATTDRAPHATETVAESLTYFLTVVHASSPAGTRRCYEQKARHVLRLLGDAQITRESAERYIAARIDEGAHTHSIHKELVVLRGAIASARQRGRFHGSPDVVPRFSAGYSPRTTYLTPDQFARLADELAQLRPNLKPRPRARAIERRNNRLLYCLLIAYASPRRAELEALRWENVDLARDRIRVPKGKTVARTIAIHPTLRPWLEQLHAGSGPVVTPWANVGRDLPAACARAGVPRVTPNDLRRTFASWLVQAGTPLIVVSRLLGHGSTRMVDLVYGQLDEGTLTDAIGRLPGGCDAGVSHAVPQNGSGGTKRRERGKRITVGDVVPRAGVEPATRGFSVPAPMDCNVTEQKRKQEARALRVSGG